MVFFDVGSSGLSFRRVGFGLKIDGSSVQLVLRCTYIDIHTYIHLLTAIVVLLQM